MGLLALVGVSVGAIAAVLRALAHQRDDAMDHIGELLAVTAFAFAFWAAGLRIDATAERLLPWVLISAGVVLVVVGTIAAVSGLWARSRGREAEV